MFAVILNFETSTIDVLDLVNCPDDNYEEFIEDDKNDLEKFSDARIEQAGSILDRAGPSAMYWMTDIAAQLAFLAAAQKNGIATNVDAKVGEHATPEAIVKAVVKG